MTIVVRAARRTDWPALRALYLHARRDTFAWLPAERFAAGDFDEHTRGEALLVAQARDEGIVGFVSVWEPERFVHHLYVAGTRLREGIGAALLRALPGWPAARYRLKCLVRNERALAFWRIRGRRISAARNAGSGDCRSAGEARLTGVAARADAVRHRTKDRHAASAARLWCADCNGACTTCSCR